MTNELNIDFRQTGLTVTATLVQGTAAVGSAINLTESVTLSGFYSGDMPAVAAGIYNVRFQSTSDRTGRGVIAWNGTAEVIIPETQIRSALGLASANVDTQLSGLATQASVDTKASQASVDALPNAGTIAAIKAKTDNLPVDPADQSELAQLIAAIPQGLTTQQNTRLTQLWQQAGFDSAVPVVRDKEGDVITETIGTTVITHTATNAGDTVTTERQP